MAQINFFMSDDDRREFHAYIFKRGGYITAEVSQTSEPRIVACAADGDIDDAACSIFLEGLHPSRRLQPTGWPFKRRSPFVTPYQQGFFVHGPRIEYLPSCQLQGGIVRGRLFDTGGWVPGRHEADGAVTTLDGTTVDAEAVAETRLQLERFYKAMAAFIRKRYRRDSAGFYHGPGSDLLQGDGVPKFQMVTSAGPVKMFSS